MWSERRFPCLIPDKTSQASQPRTKFTHQTLREEEEKFLLLRKNTNPILSSQVLKVSSKPEGSSSFPLLVLLLGLLLSQYLFINTISS